MKEKVPNFDEMSELIREKGIKLEKKCEEGAQKQVYQVYIIRKKLVKKLASAGEQMLFTL